MKRAYVQIQLDLACNLLDRLRLERDELRAMLERVQSRPNPTSYHHTVGGAVWGSTAPTIDTTRADLLRTQIALIETDIQALADAATLAALRPASV